MKHVNALVAIALVLGYGTVQAGLINNPSFEENGKQSIDGWTDTPPSIGSVVPSSITAPYTLPDGTTVDSYEYKPTDGKYFLMLESGTATTNTWLTFTQSITVTAGDVLSGNNVLSGYAAFDWNDYPPFFDEARVRITGTNIDETPWSMSGRSFPNEFKDPSPYVPPPFYISDAYGPWTLWHSSPLDAGTYTLEYGVTNTSPNGVTDSAISSYAYFDAVPTVPEPSFLALFVIGLAGLSSMQGRRRTVSLSQSS